MTNEQMADLFRAMAERQREKSAEAAAECKTYFATECTGAAKAFDLAAYILSTPGAFESATYLLHQ